MSKILSIFPYSIAHDTWEERNKRSEKLKRLNDYDTMVPLLVSENERLKKQIEILTSISRTEE